MQAVQNRVIASIVLATFAAAGGIASAQSLSQTAALGSVPAAPAPSAVPVDATIKIGPARPSMPAPAIPPGRSAADTVGEASGGGVQDAGITMIDFDAVSSNDGNIHDIGRSYAEDGFMVVVDAADAFGLRTAGSQSDLFAGSAAAYNNTVGGTTYVYAFDYSPFSLEFMEFANLANGGPVSITVHGVKFDGTEVTRTCTTSGPENREETFYFNGFNDLYYIYWTQESPFHQFDNIGIVRAPIVVDFQNLEQADASIHDQGHSYYEAGFTVSNNGEPGDLFTFGTQEPRYPGSTALFNNTAGGTTTLAQFGGGTFNVHSIDIANLNNDGPTTVTFTGHRPGGSTMSKTYKTSGSPNALETFQFTGFNNIESLTWTQDAPFHQFDNIILSRGQQTLDFIDLSRGDAQSHAWGTQYRADGFRVKTRANDAGLYSFGGDEPRFPGSTALYNNSAGGLVHIETNDGTLFQLLGLEIAPLNGAQQVTVDFIGHKSDGTQVAKSFTTSGDAIRLETVSFDDSWKGLTDVEWTQVAPYHQFDNVRMVRITTLVDMQKLEHVDNSYAYIGKVYAEQGFRVTKGQGEAFDFATYGTLSPNYNSSTAIFNNTSNGVNTLSAVDGGDFDLLQMDLSTLGTGLGAAPVNFVGTKTDGSQVTQSFTIADSFLTRQTVRFRGFSDLTSVSWTQEFPYHQFDNIVAIESVPEQGCYPDCDGNGALDLFDFLCFVNSFNAAQPYANCDGNGALDLFDFLCYVNAFNAGC